MTVDHPTFGTMCEICFSGLTPESCVVDTDGVKWDVCPGDCARQAGISEKDPSETLGHRLLPPRQLRYPGGKDGRWIIRCVCGYQTAPYASAEAADKPAKAHLAAKTATTGTSADS